MKFLAKMSMAALAGVLVLSGTGACSDGERRTDEQRNADDDTAEQPRAQPGAQPANFNPMGALMGGLVRGIEGDEAANQLEQDPGMQMMGALFGAAAASHGANPQDVQQAQEAMGEVGNALGMLMGGLADATEPLNSARKLRRIPDAQISDDLRCALTGRICSEPVRTPCCDRLCDGRTLRARVEEDGADAAKCPQCEQVVDVAALAIEEALLERIKELSRQHQPANGGQEGCILG